MNTSTKVNNYPVYKNLSLETLKNEFWLPVKGYEEFYKVSNLGRVKSLDRQRWTGSGYHLKKGIVLKQSLTTTGYLRVNLANKGKSKVWKVHQLMAISFLNHKPCGFKIVVDHKDNNPLNNYLNNLQLISNRKNTSKDRKNASKLTGVYHKKGTDLYNASIVYNKKLVHLGYFRDKNKASEAYKKSLTRINKGLKPKEEQFSLF